MSWDFAPTPENIDILSARLDEKFDETTDASSSTLAISYYLGTNVQFADIDLHPQEPAAWPFRTAAIAKCLQTSTPHETPQELSVRVDAEERVLRACAAKRMRQFIAGLDIELCALRQNMSQLSCPQYNYFVVGEERALVRRYRMQMVISMPCLVGIATNSSSDFLVQLLHAVDSGQSLSNAIERLCGVRPATARHAMKLPPQQIEANDLVVAIRLLDVLSPDHFPNGAEWETFMQLGFHVIPGLTGLARTAPASRALLKVASIKGWRRAKLALQGLQLDRATIARFTALLTAYRRTLAYEIVQRGAIMEASPEASAVRITDDLVQQVGLAKFLDAASLYPRLLREAHSTLRHEHQMRRGLIWETALVEPVAVGECVFSQINDWESLRGLANRLANCLTDYRSECVMGKMLVFSISTHDGVTIGALSVETFLSSSGRCSVSLEGSAGPKNASLANSHKEAVAGFFASLQTEDFLSRTAQAVLRQQVRYLGRGRTIEQQMAIEASITALNRLPQRRMRFSSLMSVVLGADVCA